MSILTDKTYKQYGRLSRYTTIPYYYHCVDNKYVYGTARYLKNDTPYSVHTVVRGDTWDSLALYYYNNPTLYWIICSYNRVTDAYEQPKIGQQIKIPLMSNIEFED